MNLAHLKPCLSVRTFNYREVNWNEFLFALSDKMKKRENLKDRCYVIKQILEYEPKQKKP